MVEVRSAGTMELEKLREVVNHELRQRAVGGDVPGNAVTDREFNPPSTTMRGYDESPLKALIGQAAANAVPRGLTLENVEDAFQYHPWHPGQQDRGNQVREALVHAAKVIIRNVPDGPDRAVALRKLREARMDANSAITHNGRF